MDSFNQLEDKIKIQDKSSVVFIPHITYREFVLSFFRLLTKCHCYLVYSSREMHPSSATEKYSLGL